MHVTLRIELKHDRVMASALTSALETLDAIAHSTYGRDDEYVVRRVHEKLESLVGRNAVKSVSIVDVDPCVFDLELDKAAEEKHDEDGG